MTPKPCPLAFFLYHYFKQALSSRLATCCVFLQSIARLPHTLLHFWVGIAMAYSYLLHPKRQGAGEGFDLASVIFWGKTEKGSSRRVDPCWRPCVKSSKNHCVPGYSSSVLRPSSQSRFRHRTVSGGDRQRPLSLNEHLLAKPRPPLRRRWRWNQAGSLCG